MFAADNGEACASLLEALADGIEADLAQSGAGALPIEMAHNAIRFYRGFAQVFRDERPPTPHEAFVFGIWVERMEAEARVRRGGLN